MGAAEADQLGGKGVCLDVVGGHRDRLDDRLDLLAEVFVGNAEDRHVDHLVVGDQDVLGLLGIDVHPTGDDHVRLAIGEEEEPVGVEVADIAERRPTLRAARRRGLRRVVVVLERPGAFEPDRAGLADG